MKYSYHHEITMGSFLNYAQPTEGYEGQRFIKQQVRLIHDHNENKWSQILLLHQNHEKRNLYNLSFTQLKRLGFQICDIKPYLKDMFF